MSNIDQNTVDSFGDEWSRFDQEALTGAEHAFLFNTYFHMFPWNELPESAEGFDMGCGSGRWAVLVAPKVGKINCIDPSFEALEVARRRLAHLPNANFVNAGVSDSPLPLGSQDFGYSLGVLHHIPDTRAALSDCVLLLKPGAPFLVYLYYRFDNRPFWYAWVWWLSDVLRRGICRLPSGSKSIITDFFAVSVYWPLARLAKWSERLGFKVDGWLLASYRDTSFYTMRTDSRDRFGTPLEQRFTKSEITEMLIASGLEKIRFSNDFPFWCAIAYRAHNIT